MFFRARDQGAHHILDLTGQPINRITHPKPHIQGHLVIARTPRVQALAGLPNRFRQPRFDIHVNIFKRVIKGEITGFDARRDFSKAVPDCGLVFCADDPYMLQHGGMGQAALDILAPHLAVKPDRGIDGCHDGRGAFGETSAPLLVRAAAHAEGVSFVLVLKRRAAMFGTPALIGATLLAPGASRQGWAAKGLEKLREAAAPVPAAAITFTDADGKETALAAFAGQGLVVNLWATWCPPCVAEMPALDRLQAMLRAERITVLALSSDRGGRAQVEPFYQRLGLKELAIWLDPRGAAARALGARGLPTTVIIDRAGREVARLEGEAAWDAPEWVAAVRRLVG